MHVVTGEKPENERFPGAVATYSIEAMMQDGKALQAGTSHFLGTNFAQAQNIRFQNASGELELANTTSWGVSTRMIGGVIMVHGDDDGLCVPPRIAPWQVVIVPMLRDQPEDQAIVDYCRDLQKQLGALSTLGEPVPCAARPEARQGRDQALGLGEEGRADRDRGRRPRRGRRQCLGHPPRPAVPRGRQARQPGDAARELVDMAAALLAEIQAGLLARSTEALRAQIVPLDDWAAVEAHFAEGVKNPGWVDVRWSRPTGAGLDAVVERIKALKLTIRNAPLGQTGLRRGTVRLHRRTGGGAGADRSRLLTGRRGGGGRRAVLFYRRHRPV